MAASGGPWLCEVCTYQHSDASHDALYLMCRVCGSARPAQVDMSLTVEGLTRDPPEPPRTSTSHGGATGEDGQRRTCGDSDDFGKHDPTAAHVRRCGRDPSPRRESTAVEAAAWERREGKRRRTVNDVLRPKRGAAFAPVARYTAGPHTAARDVADADLPSVAPLLLLREVLPAKLAAVITRQVAASAREWSRGTWFVHGKVHSVRRVHTHYQLTAEPAAGPRSEAATAAVEHYRDDRGDTDAAAENPASEGALDHTTPELQEATLIVAAAVVAARPNCGHWTPTYAFANRYADGTESVGWHSDHLHHLGPRPVIAGLTLGAARPFKLRRAGGGGASISVVLPHNSVLVMMHDAQEEWQHAVPQVADVGRHRLTGQARYSLTFRMERKDLPDFGTCHCGKPPALKCKGGTYWLTCNPSGAVAPCGLWMACKWADREAARLRLAEEHG
eukprot:m.14783 g.14783  ORF g.14783 m.14783 type:complete len:447 (+) comp8457_c0_seq1:59-1399(+)